MLSNYVFLQDVEQPDSTFILNTNEPYAIFRVIKFISEADMSAYVRIHGPDGVVDGYRVAVSGEGSLTGDMGNVDLKSAANWYYKNRIKVKPGYWKRWRSET